MVNNTRSDSEYLRYELIITSWSIGYSAHHDEEQELDEFLDLYLGVSLAEPVNDVYEGHATLYGSKGTVGGSFGYDSERQLHSCLWIGLFGASALVNLLANGIRPTLVLWGSKFRYREARIRDVSWFTEGHPELGDVVNE